MGEFSEPHPLFGLDLGWGPHLGSRSVGVDGLDVEEDGLDLTAWFGERKGPGCSWGGFWGGLSPFWGGTVGDNPLSGGDSPLSGGTPLTVGHRGQLEHRVQGALQVGQLIWGAGLRQ